VAERTASLDSVLQQLADFIDEHQRMKDRIQQALIYPALVLGLGVCVAVVMLGFLLPRTQKMMSGVDVEMPLLTQMMVAIGDSLWPWGFVFGLLAVGLMFVYLRRVQGRRELRVKYDKKLFGLPFFGTGYCLIVSIRFARTLAILVSSGVPVVEGVVLAGKSTGSAWVEQKSAEQSDVLRHGEPLSVVVRGIPPLSEMLPGWIEVGEVGGSLESMLNRAAERCQARFDRVLSRMLVMLEPALLLFIGGFVLLIVLAVMLPMFSLSSAIAK
jgi:general secretion pathway protein F